jgi:hypothetical protein
MAAFGAIFGAVASIASTAIQASQQAATLRSQAAYEEAEGQRRVQVAAAEAGRFSRQAEAKREEEARAHSDLMAQAAKQGTSLWNPTVAKIDQEIGEEGMFQTAMLGSTAVGEAQAEGLFQERAANSRAAALRQKASNIASNSILDSVGIALGAGTKLAKGSYGYGGSYKSDRYDS